MVCVVPFGLALERLSQARLHTNLCMYVREGKTDKQTNERTENITSFEEVPMDSNVQIIRQTTRPLFSAFKQGFGVD